MHYRNSNISNCCSSSKYPQITGNSTAITGNMNICAENDESSSSSYLVGSCKNIPICLSYSKGDSSLDNECDSSTFYDTVDGGCLWYNAFSGTDGKNKRCGSKKYFECDFYEDSSECILDNIVNKDGGCDWFIINKERVSCENKISSGNCQNYGKGVCIINDDGCDWSDIRGCTYKYFVSKFGTDSGYCQSSVPCLTLDYVIINHVN
jgi:hypothetical protein